jgi:TRAP-type C4-dicarboxylate transport system permease small subunit
LRVLDVLARACAVLAGCLLTLITLMTCASVLGRNFLGATLAGDFELTGVATGLAVALFMPWCQLRRGNILVDFFTAKASARTITRLDRLGALLLAAFMALLAWRTALGGANAWDNQSSSMLLGFPDWVVYTGMVPPLLLTAVIALYQSVVSGESTAP